MYMYTAKEYAACNTVTLQVLNQMEGRWKRTWLHTCYTGNGKEFLLSVLLLLTSNKRWKTKINCNNAAWNKIITIVYDYWIFLTFVCSSVTSVAVINCTKKTMYMNTLNKINAIVDLLRKQGLSSFRPTTWNVWK